MRAISAGDSKRKERRMARAGSYCRPGSSGRIVRLVRAAAITGRVIDESGEPMVGVTV